jgi:phage terminase large subunit-like protein
MSEPMNIGRNASLTNVQHLLALSPGAMSETIESWSADQLVSEIGKWEFWARAGQLPPEGSWRLWLVLAGRGFGKTRMGAEWVRARAEENGNARIALVGATIGEVRSVMVEGESGLLALPENILGGFDGLRRTPFYEPSLRRLTWPNGAVATLYSAAQPDSLRGGQHHFAWADEIAKWKNGIAAWDNLMMGLRLGNAPRVVATTTPRTVPLVRRLVDEAKTMPDDSAVTNGRTRDNEANLPGSFIAAMELAYAGTRTGRQELNGELIEDIAGALWTRDLIERQRTYAVPEMQRIVIGVDPPVTAGGDACGIIAVGRGADDRAYVLADHSVSGASPERWARAVASAHEIWNADRIVAEGNQGGEMVESTLRAANLAMPVKRVHASRGKSARAEPVAALYEAKRAWHAGTFPQLEDEMCGLIMGGGYEGPGRSPDRADAMVWAMSELMLGRGAGVMRARGL